MMVLTFFNELFLVFIKYLLSQEPVLVLLSNVYLFMKRLKVLEKLLKSKE